MTTIYCYSGSGNTYAVAEAAAQVMDGVGILPCNPVREHPASGRVGFCFPVYFGGLPRGFREFLEGFPARRDVDYFAFSTYGGAPGNALPIVRDMLRARGASLVYARPLRAVANYVALYEVKTARALARAETLRRNARDAAQEIIAGKKRGAGVRLPLIESLIKYPDPDEDRAFIVDRDACHSCGFCEKACVRGNVSLNERGFPVWNHNCDQCMACIHWCPVLAIDYGVRTVGRTRYHCPGVRLEQLPR